jgi:hypothetical protein
MKRQTIAKSVLVQILIDETIKVLGEHAHLLRKQIRIRQCDGEPNWDADCGVTRTSASRDFHTAKRNARKIFDISPISNADAPHGDSPSRDAALRVLMRSGSTG